MNRRGFFGLVAALPAICRAGLPPVNVPNPRYTARMFSNAFSLPPWAIQPLKFAWKYKPSFRPMKLIVPPELYERAKILMEAS